MTDYADEQAQEVCALQAILMDEFEELDAEHPDALPHAGKSYQILIRPEGDDEAAQVENDLRLSLTFAHPPTYPDVPPLLRARRADCDELERLLQSAAGENLGMAHIFSLHSAAREWLRARAHFTGSGDLQDAAARRAAEAEAREARVLAARAAGTAVTRESYDAWAARFAAETAPAVLSEAELEKAKRLTGKRWFELRKEKGGEEGEAEEEAEAEAEEVEEEEEGEGEGEEEEEEEEDDPDFVVPSSDEEEAVLDRLRR